MGQTINVPPAGIAIQTPSPISAPLNLKRPYGAIEGVNAPGGLTREIRPKPSTGGPFGQASPIEQPPKKKRGRPTKAEAAARAEASSAPGEPSSAPRSLSVGASSMTPVAGSSLEPAPVLSAGPTSAIETRPSGPPVSRVPISSIVTPSIPTTTSQSSSSSGKRRRARSTRSEPEDLPRASSSGVDTSSRDTRQYESPYARMGTEPQPSPARTAILRHREDVSPSTPSQPEPTQQLPTTQPLSTSAPDPPRSM
jgi:hypothetical protein